MTTAQQTKKVYLAGPMFSAGDKMEQSALASALEAAGSNATYHRTTGSRSHR